VPAGETWVGNPAKPINKPVDYGLVARENAKTCAQAMEDPYVQERTRFYCSNCDAHLHVEKGMTELNVQGSPIWECPLCHERWTGDEQWVLGNFPTMRWDGDKWIKEHVPEAWPRREMHGELL
jgi:ribosomal protein L37AE/L43A